MRGSVFKRCSRCGARVNQRRCGKCGGDSFSWNYVIDIGRDSTGRRRQRLRGGFPTKRDADRALRELLLSLDRGGYVQPKRTLEGFLREEWLPSIKGRVKANTFRDRRLCVESYIVPRVGALPLQELNVTHVNQLYGELLTTGSEDGMGLSPASVRRTHVVLRRALSDAVRWGLVARNVTDHADPPSTKQVTVARRQAMRTWTAEQLRAFLITTRSHRFHALWLVAATTGMRRSELLGLRWDDVDLDSRVLTCRWTLISAGGQPVHEDSQKTDASGRTVNLDQHTVACLRAHRVSQAQERLAAGPAWPDQGLVFTWEDGRGLHPDGVSHEFARLVEASGLPRIRLHDVRHTHATLMLKAGVHPKIVSERLGHSSVAFTLDTYSHVLPGMQAEAAELFADMVVGDTNWS